MEYEINLSDYAEDAKGLQPGMSIKVPHLGCSCSNAMKITEEVEGTQYKCFKCGAYLFHSSYNSPRERLARQATYEATMRIRADVSYELPVDFSRTIPPIGLAWLGLGGWTLNMIDKYNVGWSEELRRVILPCHAGYTARSVHSWNQPKYLEKVPNGVMWESQNESFNKWCVICEDILSAGRCGNFLKAYAILGTSLSTKQLTRFIDKDVMLWLDPDKGGLSGVRNIAPRLGMVTNSVHIIHSDADPKSLTDNKIKEFICTTN